MVGGRSGQYWLEFREPRKSNFFVLYHTDEKEYETQICASIENEFFEITLMEDYLNNWLHIKSVDLNNNDISFFDFDVSIYFCI